MAAFSMIPAHDHALAPSDGRISSHGCLAARPQPPSDHASDDQDHNPVGTRILEVHQPADERLIDSKTSLVSIARSD